MSLQAIDPRDMGVREWTDAMALGLEQYGSVPQLIDPSRWHEWAAAVVGMSPISGVALPTPYDFVDWREWAMRFNEIMESWS